MTRTTQKQTRKRGTANPAGKAAQRTAIAHRRQTVASLALAYVPQHRIADQVGVAESTVSKDLAAIRAGWLAEAQRDVEAAMVRELHSLDVLEARMWTQLATKTLEPDERTRTALAILKCKERRAKMLGFDQPDLLDITVSDEKLRIELQRLREELGYDGPRAIEA